MSSAFLFAALAATGITYEWRPVDDAQGGHEYVVTVEPDLMQAALDGKAKTFRSDVPRGVNDIRSIVVKLGQGPSEPVRHGVLKPPVEEAAGSDHAIEEEPLAPIRHSVYQQPYPPQNYQSQGYATQDTLEDGFRRYNAVAAEPRKSIGSELVKGTEKLLDGTGRVFRDTGQMVEGTAKNIGDGLRSVVAPGVTPTAGVAAPQQPGDYQPFSYNQPTYNAAPTHAPIPNQQHPNATNNQAYAGSVGQPAWNGGSAAPNLASPVNGQQDYRQQTPSTQNQPAYPTNQQPPAGNNSPDLSQYAGQQNNRGGQAYVDFAAQRNDAYDEPFVPIRNTQSVSNTSDYRSNQGQNPQPPVGAQQNYAGQNGSGGYNGQPPAPTNDSWPEWPERSQTAGNQNASQPNGGTPYPQGPQTAGYGPGQGPDPSNWANGGAIDGQNNAANTAAAPQADQQAGGQNPADGKKDQWWYGLVAVAAIGSIAWNFYLGMNYIDARNKYRAALRRSGRAYSEVLDDM